MAEQLLAAVEGVVTTKNFDSQPLAAQYLAVANAVAAAGYQAQRIDLPTGSRTAQVWALPASTDGHLPSVTTLRVEENASGWSVAR